MGAGNVIRVFPFWIFFHSSEICLRSLVVNQNVPLHVPGRAPDTCQTSPEHWVVSGFLESTLSAESLTSSTGVIFHHVTSHTKIRGIKQQSFFLFADSGWEIQKGHSGHSFSLLQGVGGLTGQGCGTHFPSVCSLTQPALTWAGQAEGWAPAETVHLHSPLFALGFSWHSNWVLRSLIWRGTFPKEPGRGCMAFSVLMLVGSPIVSPLPYLLISWSEQSHTHSPIARDTDLYL